MLYISELDIKAKIKKYKNDINPVKINEFPDEIRQALSEFQDSIGLGEEAVDEVGNKIGDKIISDTYLEVAYDLLSQEQLSKAKVFCEEAARLDKENPLVYKCLASIWFEKQNYNKALVELNKAKRLFVQKKMSKEANEIDLFINRIPVSSQIIHLIEKLFIK